MILSFLGPIALGPYPAVFADPYRAFVREAFQDLVQTYACAGVTEVRCGLSPGPTQDFAVAASHMEQVKLSLVLPFPQEPGGSVVTPASGHSADAASKVRGGLGWDITSVDIYRDFQRRFPVRFTGNCKSMEARCIWIESMVQEADCVLAFAPHEDTMVLRHGLQQVEQERMPLMVVTPMFRVFTWNAAAGFSAKRYYEYLHLEEQRQHIYSGDQ